MRRLPSQQQGAALIIVLAFVVLLTVLTVAYFSLTTADRQIAHTSFNQSNADQIASSGVAIILGDLRQEIINGSASPAPIFGPSPTASPYYLYTPTSPNYMVPKRSGTPGAGATPIPNLVRRSVSSDPILTPGLPSRASAVNSVTDPSANGRSIRLPRWNKHYLIPKLITAGGDASTDPVTSFVAPDWVMVTAEEGAAVLASPTTDSNGNAVTPVGRYAYAIYDVGGLLDVNVAGYPTNSSISQIGRKGSLAYADLSTQSILPYPIPNSSTEAYQLDKVVGWRNYATTQPSNNFPDSTFAANFQTSSTAATSFYKYIVSNSNGFLGPNPTATPYNDRTDQAFVSRQQLVAFRSALGFSPNVLQHLTTYSRQFTAPSWSPATPNSINPDFRTLRVTAAFTRNDGTTAAIGEPLVKKRFSLQRLNWLTYKGPSAYRDGIANNHALEPDLVILTATFGVDTAYMQKGTDLTQTTADTANIYKYFGLVWDAANERWSYIGHPASPSATSPLATSIATFGVGGTQAATREPDFFELLQAGILNTSLGSSGTSDPALPTSHQQSKMLHILTIGANLIGQSRTDSYPVRIAFDSGGGTVMEAVGSTRLPYLNSLAACAVASTSGGMNWLVVPNLWNPYRNTWDLLETSPVPQYPRPAVRIRATGSVSFATVAAATPAPTPVPTPTPTPSPAPTPTP